MFLQLKTGTSEHGRTDGQGVRRQQPGCLAVMGAGVSLKTAVIWGVALLNLVQTNPKFQTYCLIIRTIYLVMKAVSIYETSTRLYQTSRRIILEDPL